MNNQHSHHHDKKHSYHNHPYSHHQIKHKSSTTTTTTTNINELGGINEKTYLISGNSGLDHQILKEILKENQWKEIKPIQREQMPHFVSFVWIELCSNLRFDSRVFSIGCVLKNMLDSGKHIVTDKYLLHTEMNKHFPELSEIHLANTKPLNSVTKINPGEVLIIRPVGTGFFSGKGIIRVSTQQELESVRQSYSSHYIPTTTTTNKVIASRYILHPVLWEERKFHLRMYWLVQATSQTRPFHATLWDQGKILTAEKRYSPEIELLHDNAIHDTHANTTPRNLFFPADFPSSMDPKPILSQMRYIMDHVGKLIEPVVHAYPESQIAYEVFGCDFIVEQLNDSTTTATTTGRVILMEINDKVGYLPVGNDPDTSGKYKEFTKSFYMWVYQTAIAPVFSFAK